MKNSYLSACIEEMRKNAQIQESVIEWMESPRKKLLYGTGLQACVCMGIFRDMKLEIEGLLNFSSSEKPVYHGYWGSLMNKAVVFKVEDFNDNKSNYDVLITTERSLVPATREILKQQGFPYIFDCAWGSNQNMKEIAYRVYCDCFHSAD